jgi:hypothetical protein
MSKIYFIIISILLISCDKVDIVTIYNEKQDEKIYLKHITSFDREVNVLSLSKYGFHNSSADYETQLEFFLYKLENDTLYIYGGWDYEVFNIKKFKTNIKYTEFAEINNEDFLFKNYKKLGYKVFPKEKEYIIINSSK